MNVRLLTGVLCLGLIVPAARADYSTHPFLAPEERCGNLAGGPDDPDCQPLYWDFEPPTEIGETRWAIPEQGYPNGPTDRPVPMYFVEENGSRTMYERDTVADPDFPHDPSKRTAVAGAELLCSTDPDVIAAGDDPAFYVPFWRPTGETQPYDRNGDGDTDDDGEFVREYEVDCKRGTRLYFGPWWFGQDPNFSGDELEKTWRAVFRVANANRVQDDIAAGRNDGTAREWYTGLEIYNHVGSHHANMWDPVKDCNDPDSGQAYDPACTEESDSTPYQQKYYEDSGCRSDPYQFPGEGPKRGCSANSALGNPSQWRAATQYPGRFEVDFPEGRALPILQNQLWPIEHHVVSRGLYFGANRNFNEQEGGVVGEIVLQVFSAPYDPDGYKRISVLFETVVEAASLYVPPFTVAPNMGVWYAPYDLELALLTTHSHKRTVRSWADITPANPPRPNDTDPLCGGTGGQQQAEHIYENYQWDDANTCKYFESPDGTIKLRKGQGIVFGCLFNNGVRITQDMPEAAGDAIRNSPVGEQLLYGRQIPDIYRVKFGCEEIPGAPYNPDDETLAFVPPGRPPLEASRNCTAPTEIRSENTPPFDEDYPIARPDECPELDGDGNRTDYTGRCVPSSIVFSDAQDEMCILVGAYWPMETPVDYDVDVNGQAVRDGIENQDPSKAEEVLIVGDEPVSVDPDRTGKDEEGNVDPETTGTPGRLPKSPSDIGKCEDCSQAFPPLI